MSIPMIGMVALGVVLVAAAGEPMFAVQCPTLIKQANERLAGMDQQSETVRTAEALVVEADRLHKAGDHYGSIAAAHAALAGLNPNVSPPRSQRPQR